MHDEILKVDAPNVVYDIRNDPVMLSDIAPASLSRGPLGLAMEHGIVGSPEWWTALRIGQVEVRTFLGIIIGVDGGPMGDSAIVRIENKTGEIMSWVAWNGFKQELIGQYVKVAYSPVAPKRPPRPGFIVEVLLQVQVDMCDNDRSPIQATQL